jgi:hypothetical protein
MFKKVVAVITLTALSGAPTLLAVDLPLPTLVDCASAAEPVKISAVVPPDTVSARAYFKAIGEPSEYFVELHRASDGSMWGYLPPPLATTKSFSYRVISQDAKGKQISSLLFLTTTSATCPPHAMKPEEARAASNLVLGLTVANQPPVPGGFQCRGVVSYITVAGEMKQNDECRRMAALESSGHGAPGSAPGSATAGGATPAGGTTAGGATGGGTTGGTTAGGTGGGAAGGGAAGGAAGAGGGTGIGGKFLNPATVIALTGGVIAGAAIERHRHHRPVSPSRP